MMLVAVGLSTGTPAANATALEQMHDADVKREAIFSTPVILGAVTLPSAIWGYYTTKKCRAYLGQRSGTDAPWLVSPAPTLAPGSDSSQVKGL